MGVCVRVSFSVLTNVRERTMEKNKLMRLIPMILLGVWQAATPMAYGQVQEARVWIEGMT